MKRKSKIFTSQVKQAHFDWLLHQLELNCSLKLKEMQAKLFTEFGYAYTISTIFRVLKYHELTNNITERHAIQQSQNLRDQFRHLMRPVTLGGIIEAKHVVFLDETHCGETNIHRRYGWARRGQPAWVRGRCTDGQSAPAIAAMSIFGVQSVTVSTDTIDSVIFMHVLLNQSVRCLTIPREV